MKSRNVVVLIRDLELLARIGVHGHEQGKPQPVRINVALTAEMGAAKSPRKSFGSFPPTGGSNRTLT